MKVAQDAEKSEIAKKINMRTNKLRYLKSGVFTESIKNLRSEFGELNSLTIKDNDDVEFVDSEFTELLNEASKLLNDIKLV